MSILEIDQRFLQLAGFDALPAATPFGVYEPARVHKGVAYVSGHPPKLDGEVVYTGRIGEGERDIDYACAAARLCAIQCLVSLSHALGSLSRVEAILHVTGFVNATTGFTSLPQVLDGGSKFLHEVFGADIGAHARTPVGAFVLARNSSVVLDMRVAVRD